jgi:O-antigen ligase
MGQLGPVMNKSDLFIVLSVGIVLFGLTAVAGPTIGMGMFVGLALITVIFAYPMVGLGLMLLAGTALQVLGSGHIIGLPVSFGKIAGASTLVAWLLRTMLDREPLTYSPQLLAFGCFLLGVGLSTLTASDPDVAWEGLSRNLELFLLLLIVASIAGQSAGRLDATCLALTACMTASAIIGLLEFFVPSLSIESDDPSLVQGALGAVIDRDSLEGVEIKRITGGLSDSNWFGYTLAAVIPLNLYLWQRYSALAIRVMILAAATLQSAGIVLSYTRSALLALVAVVVVLTLKRRLALGPVLAAALVGSIAVVIWNPAGLQRVYSTGYLREGSTPLRSYLLQGAFELFQQQPLTGYGNSQFGPNFHDWLLGQSVSESIANWHQELERRVASGEEKYEWVMPHNTALQIATEYGLIGLVPFTAVFVFVFRDLNVARHFGTPRQALLSDCLTAGMVGLFVSTMFGHLALLKIIWIIPGLAAALRRVALSPGIEQSPGLPRLGSKQTA